MGKRSKRLGAIFFAILLMAGWDASQGATMKKIKVAVASFGDQSGKGLGSSATDYVTSNFVDLKYFTVLERSRLDQVMKEVARQQTDLVDESTAVNLGKQIGAQVVVVGNVSSASYQVGQQACKLIDPDGEQYQGTCPASSADATINIRMVNVETGEVIFSDILKGSETKSYNPGEQYAPEGSQINVALRKAAVQLYGAIQHAFPLVGTVVQKKDQIIYVDLGSDFGISKGRKMTFYKEKGKQIKNAKTGEVLGYERTELGDGKVSEVMPTVCKVKVGKGEAEDISEGDAVIAKPEGLLSNILRTYIQK
jgi:hypothetical protein